QEKPPMHIIFLSADTGGGHRASAEALAKQFLIQYPGSTYELIDVWSDHGVLPYRTLVNTYKRMSANPFEWRIFYHLSNTKLNEVCANIHSRITSGRAIKKRLQSSKPDCIISVHPTMNHTPLKATNKISKELGIHIPFYTVVTDLGSGHCMWFERNVDKLYVASDRLYNLARKRGGTAPEDIVQTGLPIRHGFAIQNQKLMGDRTSKEGLEYQLSIRKQLKVIPNINKQCILIMGGGEGVGSLSQIVHELYISLTKNDIDATICVVCGRNEKSRGNVDIVPLGFLTNIPEYMVAADILVSKAGPGTIAEAAAVGLPVMMTSFLPGQEAGNVDVVLESQFGEYNNKPTEIASIVTSWLQDPTLLTKLSQSAMEAGNPYAADEIVNDIGSNTVAWMNLNKQ
ncbi:UDP-Glycosyltransferase/glycogen phosphorylase, partial [Fragilariopsis cylindrus CCMP1102]